MDTILNTLEGIWESPFVRAVTFLIIALLSAFAVSFIAKKLLGLFGLDEKLDSWGINEGERGTARKFVGKLAFLIVFLLFLPSVFEALGLESVSDPINDFVGAFIRYIPRIIAATVIIFLGVFIGRILSGISEALLKKSGIDTVGTKLLRGNSNKRNDESESSLTVSAVLSKAVAAIIIIAAVAQGVKILNLEILTEISSTVIAYLPSVIKAVLVAAVALFGIRLLDGVGEKNIPGGKLILGAARCAIYIVAAFMILSQLEFASMIVNWTFILLIGAVSVAFAIAFGIGGRDFAKSTLEEINKNKKGGDDNSEK